MRVVFPFIAQLHQVPHALPVALEMARRHSDAQVHVAVADPRALPFIRRLAADYAPDAVLHYHALRLDPLNAARVGAGKVAWKQLALLANCDYFRGFDAIVTPERTSLFLRRIGVNQPALVWTRHGAGDRSVGFSTDVHRFDFVLMASRRIERRLLDAGQIRPGHYVVGIYAKFDWLRAAGRPAARLFDNDRPTVLYNPHFSPALSSWPRFGQRVLEQFADSRRYNLIFAPHIRLFHPAPPASYKAFRRYAGLPHVHVDLGSDRSVDMSYTRAADLYLGDVSSQVCEFLHTPRPCLFLDAHDAPWQHSPSYAFWTLGDVSRTPEGIEAQVGAAFAGHARYQQAQQHYFDQTFELPQGISSAAVGADAVMSHLRWRAGAAIRRGTAPAGLAAGPAAPH